jgi:hypothetical protein
MRSNRTSPSFGLMSMKGAADVVPPAIGQDFFERSEDHG